MFDLNMTLIAQVLNFFVLLVILKKFAYKPLLDLMEARRQRVISDLENAEKNKIASEELKATYEKQLAEVKHEAQVIMDKANKLANETREEIIAQARAEQERLIEAARDQIAREQQKAMMELRNEVASLSMLVATQIVGKSMDEQKDKQIIADVLSKLDDKQGGLPC